ncbi:MAG: DUF3891 family protein [Solirubrobacterales bacterium]
MVLREHEDSVLCIPQSEHARISGQIAAAWGNERVPRAEPAAELALAAARHDIGMDAYDAEPELDPEAGLPRSFMTMPLEEHVRCWRRGPSLVVDEDPYAAILVSLHGTTLMARKHASGEAERELVADYLETQEELRAGLRDQLSSDPHLATYLEPDPIERGRRLLALWDAMSLGVCLPRLPQRLTDTPAGEPPVVLAMGYHGSGGGERGAEDPHAVTVDPWPFDTDEVHLWAEGRRLQGRFAEAEPMRAALREAPRERLTIVLVR